MTEERSYLRRPGESLVVSGGAVIEVTAIPGSGPGQAPGSGPGQAPGSEAGAVLLKVTGKGCVHLGEDLVEPPRRGGYRTAPGSRPGQAQQRKEQR